MLYIYEHALVSKLNRLYRLTVTSIGQCCIHKKQEGAYIHWKPGYGGLGGERG